MSFYIGTEDKVLSIPYPKQEAPENFTKFVEGGKYINGGSWVYGGQYAAKTTTLSFPRKNREEMEVFNGLGLGKYGAGYIYWHDPFASNLLPSYLSIPVAGRFKVPTWDRFAAVVEKGLTPDNAFGLPTRSALITLPDGGMRKAFTFVVPDECDLALSVKGDPLTSTTDFTLAWGDSAVTVPVCGLGSLWDRVVANPKEGRLATLTVSNPGTLDLYGMMVSAVPHLSTVASVTRKMPAFVTGTGQSGCQLSEDTLTNTLYSLGQAWEQQPMSYTLTETEWFSQ